MSTTTYRGGNSYTSGVVLVVLALVAGSFVAGNAYMVVSGHSLPEHPMLTWGLIALFGLIPVGLIVVALKAVRARRVFGLLELHVAKAPGEKDNLFRALLQVPRSRGVQSWQVSVRCQYWQRRGGRDSKRISRETVWEAVVPVTAQPSPPGVFLKLEAAIPRHLPPTGDAGTREGYDWDILVQGRDMTGAEMLEDSFRIDILRPAVENKESFAVEELAQETPHIDEYSTLTSSDMRLGSDRAWFAEHLWRTPAERTRYRLFITGILVAAISILLVANWENPEPLLHGLVATPVAALLIYLLMKLRLFRLFVVVGFAVAGFGAAAWFSDAAAFFTAFILLTLLPFTLQAWFGLDRFELQLAAGGIEKRHARGIGKSDETIAWEDISKISVLDGKVNAIRKRDAEKTGQFTVVVEHGGRRCEISPPFADADDAAAVAEWLEEAKRRYS